MLNISDNFKDTKKVDRILESSLDFQFFFVDSIPIHMGACNKVYLYGS